MPALSAFTGLLYDPAAGDLADLTAPPYDAISESERERFLAADPHNIVRLILGRDEPGDGVDANKYTRAAEYLRSWRRSGVLVSTDGPAIYPYEMSFRLDGRERRVRGLIVAVDLEAFGGSIVPHERTMPGPIGDRLSLIREVRTNLSPVYGVLRGPSGAQAAVLDRALARPADRELVDEAGVRHRLWVEPAVPSELVEAYRAETLLIADGHHRYTTALAYREERRAVDGPGPWDRIMMLVVDGVAEDPPVLPIHRVVTLPAGDPPMPDGPITPATSLDEALASLDDRDVRIAVATAGRDGSPAIGVAGLVGDPPAVSALHGSVLADVPDEAVRYVPDPNEAIEAVQNGATAAYLLPNTRVQTIRAVLEAGGRLPHKSTWFWPKPRSGMVLRPLE